MTPEEMLRRLLYRDGLMLIIDKPAGIAVHKGPKSAQGSGESLEDHFDVLRFGLPRAPALAHRLDRDTSGCLVLGRHRKALATLGHLFKHGKIGKTYWAVVEGGPAADAGRIDLPLGRLDDTRGWWMKPDPAGQPAATVWKVLGRFSPPPCGEGLGVGVERDAPATPNSQPPSPTLPHKGGGRLSWLALEPLTGRTHQLRVHCAAMGWPIVGDNIYGAQASLRRLRKEDLPRTGGPILHLCAREVVVPLYKNRDPIRVSAPAPEHMRARLAACGWNGEAKTLAAAGAQPNQ
jgi:tRNA pseudouridine32 synthase/23S rRNA pseudouridine746 synthase